jgi:hypothetical protein
MREVMTISKDSKQANQTPQGEPGKASQQAPQPTKTDQEILEELRQAGGGNQRRRSVGLTAFVVLLAVVVAIFTAVNSNKEKQVADVANNEQNVASTENETIASTAETDNEEQEDSEESTEAEDGDADENTDDAADADEANDVDATTPTTFDTTTANGEAVGETPNAQSAKSEDSYSEAAQVGEGVTHLARRALHSFLADRSVTDLSAAHRIFAEDYVAKNSSPVYLGIGEGRTFSTSLLDEAVTNARALTPAELANLNQLYVPLVPGL